MDFCPSVCCRRSCDDLVGRAQEGCCVVEDFAFEDCALVCSLFEGSALEDGVIQFCGSTGRELGTRAAVDDMRGR
jgi:hypothetical protein